MKGSRRPGPLTCAGMRWSVPEVGTNLGTNANRGQDAMNEIRLTPDALTWKEHPNIPKRGQVVILVGDPTKAGEVVVQRLRFPPN